MSYIKPQITPPSPLIFAILNGGSKRRWIRQIWDHHVENPRKKLAIWLGGWGGDAWVRFGLAHFLQRLIVFWWFLQTYMTSGPCSSWFFLVMKSWFFWYYLGLQVMAILFFFYLTAKTAYKHYDGLITIAFFFLKKKNTTTKKNLRIFTKIIDSRATLFVATALKHGWRISFCCRATLCCGPAWEANQKKIGNTSYRKGRHPVWYTAQTNI